MLCCSWLNAAGVPSILQSFMEGKEGFCVSHPRMPVVGAETT